MISGTLRLPGRSRRQRDQPSPLRQQSWQQCLPGRMPHRHYQCPPAAAASLTHPTAAWALRYHSQPALQLSLASSHRPLTRQHPRAAEAAAPLPPPRCRNFAAFSTLRRQLWHTRWTAGRLGDWRRRRPLPSRRAALAACRRRCRCRSLARLRQRRRVSIQRQSCRRLGRQLSLQRSSSRWRRSSGG